MEATRTLTPDDTSAAVATVNLRQKGSIAIILHLGAKGRDTPVRIGDPCQVLTWHGVNRASFTVTGMDALRERTPAIRAILAQWLSYV